MIGTQSLELTLWLDAIARLRNRHLSAGRADMESQLRHAFHLMQLAPPHLGKLRSELSEDAYEELLAQERFAKAAAALARPLAALNVDSSGLLDIALAMARRARPGPGPQTEAAAVLLGVWLAFVQTVTEAPVRPLAAARPQDPQATRAERPLKPIRR